MITLLIKKKGHCQFSHWGLQQGYQCCFADITMQALVFGYTVNTSLLIIIIIISVMSNTIDLQLACSLASCSKLLH